MPRNTPKNLLASLSLAALLSIYWAPTPKLVAFPFELARTCHSIGDYYDRQTNGNGDTIRVNMVAASSLIKHLTDDVFGTRGAKSQYVTDSAHALYQFHLLE